MYRRPNPPKNYIALVLDASGSMATLRDSALRAFNAELEAIRRETQRTGIETLVSVYTFNTNVVSQMMNYSPANTPALTKGNYRCDGGTALLDAVGKAVENAEAMPDSGDDNVSFLVKVITDGDENSSRTYRPDSFQRMIRTHQATDRWTFVFQVPSACDKRTLQGYGIPANNIAIWDATEEGMQEASVQTVSGISHYYTSRARGIRSLDTFFVKADLSKVATQDLKSLDNMTGRVKRFSVDKEASIKQFTEGKTGREYVIGQTSYLLMKPETVQPQKSVMLMEKGSKNVYGGPLARNLIGLPFDANAKLDPFNLSHYDVFIESTSVNRKLPRGTSVLIDGQPVFGKTPTWVS